MTGRGVAADHGGRRARNRGAPPPIGPCDPARRRRWPGDRGIGGGVDRGVGVVLLRPGERGEGYRSLQAARARPSSGRAVTFEFLCFRGPWPHLRV